MGDDNILRSYRASVLGTAEALCRCTLSYWLAMGPACAVEAKSVSNFDATKDSAAHLRLNIVSDMVTGALNTHCARLIHTVIHQVAQ